MYEALGHQIDQMTGWDDVYPTLRRYFGVTTVFLGGLADRNNDGMSRERIADYVESLGK